MKTNKEIDKDYDKHKEMWNNMQDFQVKEQKKFVKDKLNATESKHG